MVGDGDLQSGTDNGDHGGAGSSGGHGRAGSPDVFIKDYYLSLLLVSVDKTRQGNFKMFLWAQQDINTALLAVTCGLDPWG